MGDVERLQAAIAAFAEAREWGQFHTPRTTLCLSRSLHIAAEALAAGNGSAYDNYS